MLAEFSRRTSVSNPYKRFVLPLVIRSIDDIESILKRPGEARRLPRSGVKVALIAPPDHARRFEERLEAYVAACGCGESATAAMIIFATGLIYTGLATVRRGAGLFILGDLLITLFAAILIAGVVKAAAIRFARFRFLRAGYALLAAITKNPGDAA